MGLKKVKIEDAVGMTLAHDITEIVPGRKKHVAFKRNITIESKDIEKFLALGKEHVYVLDGVPPGVHEDEAGLRIARSILGEHMELSSPREGKVEIRSTVKGLFYVNTRRLLDINRIEGVILSTLPNRHPVKAGDRVAATKIRPLYIEEEELRKVESAAEKGVIKVAPFKSFNVGMVVTGNEVYTGRVQDGSHIVESKLMEYGLSVSGKMIVPDNVTLIRDAVISLFDKGADLVMTTSGLSVDPDDVTQEGIEATGAEVIFFGTPVFPGAMLSLSRLKGKYIIGAPGGVFFNRYTVLDMVLPRIIAGEKVRKKDILKLAYGGLCLNCDVCTYPICYFGNGVQ
ncbi:MAG: molybdopterin-binding protein [Syntrophobacteraceae bacterium]